MSKEKSKNLLKKWDIYTRYFCIMDYAGVMREMPSEEGNTTQELVILAGFTLDGQALLNGMLKPIDVVYYTAWYDLDVKDAYVMDVTAGNILLDYISEYDLVDKVHFGCLDEMNKRYKKRYKKRGGWRYGLISKKKRIGEGVKAIAPGKGI
jgi:hypothetical protein